MRLQRMVPMLAVKDIRKSVEFYCDALGFHMESTRDKLEEWNWAYLTNGSIHLMLSGRLEQPEGTVPEDEPEDTTSYYFYPDDLAVFHQALTIQGYPVSDLYVTFYGMKEFWLTDPDGHLLTFGEQAQDIPS